jgi:hypothetical protein
MWEIHPVVLAHPRPTLDLSFSPTLAHPPGGVQFGGARKLRPLILVIVGHKSIPPIHKALLYAPFRLMNTRPLWGQLTPRRLAFEGHPAWIGGRPGSVDPQKAGARGPVRGYQLTALNSPV